MMVMLLLNTSCTGAAASADEARYLVGFLNSNAITERVRPLQGRGQHNPRDIDKYVWRIPIPLYDPADERHRAVAHLSAQAEICRVNWNCRKELHLKLFDGEFAKPLQRQMSGSRLSRSSLKFCRRAALELTCSRTDGFPVLLIGPGERMLGA